jgi:hypothetical protein
MNTYHCHSSSFSNPGSRCPQISSAAVSAQYWRTANATRLAGRPFIISEHNHYFWNQYQREDGLIFGAYSAFQGFSGVTVHSAAVQLEVKKSNDCASVARSPVYLANEFITAFLYKRGDVQEAKHRVELDISKAFLDKNGDTAINSEQSKIGLLTGFNIAYPWLNKPAGVGSPSPPDIRISPGSGAGITVGDMYTDIVDGSGKDFDLGKFTAGLKAKGILSDENKTDCESGVYQNENGQICLRSREKLIKVITDKTEGVALEAGHREKLGYLTVVDTTVPAAVAAVPLDGLPLDRSARIVLVYSTETVNTGMTVSADRSVLYDLGKLPILLRCGKLTVDIQTAAPEHEGYSLYALGMNGSRRQKLPLTRKANQLLINIDTAALNDGPTVFFELVRNESSAQ